MTGQSDSQHYPDRDHHLGHEEALALQYRLNMKLRSPAGTITVEMPPVVAKLVADMCDDPMSPRSIAHTLLGLAALAHLQGLSRAEFTS